MIRRLLAALFCAAAATPAAAQLPAIFPAGSRVLDTWYPKVFWTSREGFTAGGYYAIILQHTYETFDDPAPYWAAVRLDGQVSKSGSRYLTLDGYAPRWADGWRFRVTLSAQRHNRDPYFGLGNATTFDDANIAADELFYRAQRLRTFARVEVQRRIVGGLRVLAGGHLEHWRLDSLTATSRLGQDVATGNTPALGRGVNDRSARFGIVFDSRNDEAVPRRGLLIEAIHALGEADGTTYQRTLVSARGYLTLAERFQVSARAAGQRMGGDPRIGSLYLIEAADQPFEGLGGPHSHRGLERNRLLGRHKLFANLDVGYTLFEVPTLARVALVAFLDAGRVFEGENFRITTDGLQVGGGGGLLFHLFRAAVLGVSVAGGPDGVIVHAHTRWPY